MVLLALHHLVPLGSLLACGTYGRLTELAGASSSKPEAANAPLSQAETFQLTEGLIQQIWEDPRASQIANLLSFYQGSNTRSARNAKNSSCKTFPGDDNWPTIGEWDTLNDLLGGALISSAPVAAPCYNSAWGPKDLSKCNEVIRRFGTPSLHEDDPTSIMWPIYQGRTCFPRNDTTTEDTCTLGGYPTYAVNVTSVAQIQLALNFARNANIRVVVKNTGHCYLGKSSGAGSLSIWMHNLKEIKYLPSYIAKGYMGSAMKADAGTTVQEVYRAAEAQGGTIQGGVCESVGFVGGYLQGGGHNPLSGYYGMAADSVLGYQVVTADGRFVTASEESEPELFWALRGGGGSTFGIVTSAIVKVHPKIQVTHSTFELGNTTNQTVSRENFWKGVRKYWEMYPEFTDAGTYSWYFIFNTDGQLTLRMRSFFVPGHTIESYNNLTKPLFDRINELGIPFKAPHNSTHYDSFFPAYWDAWGSTAQPMGSAQSLPGNRLIPKANWDDPVKFNLTFDTLMKHVNNARHFGCYHQAPKNPQNVDNAVSSAWRHAQSFFITQSPRFTPNSTTEQIFNANKVLQDDILQPWRDITPATEGGGSYLNEASVMEPKWQEDFYGDKYPRLLEIKKQYDPEGLFYATTAVGSEQWVVNDGDQGVQTQNGRLCRL
ncbi:FAD-binding domain-containing protein [Aaosphaeria arxii CBS 175.79]|uniref:FAD-binding domain-containing protein n=1 Tax=Aaosphaeria arxii CBS 175.79 TaxID=1450172 RepID=A0A6A5Y3Y3_9PLEO|nr:FAD-binding domain-containing protein [Aaosphaeria arxii CBS 175.79]KAF2019530.1 FAD-binding domain-containing protein [Aaosphaeria arxii CBS 175.79]